MNRLAAHRKAFTLIEIMIVVAIIGILLAIAVPAWLRQRQMATKRACQENLTKIDGAKQQWAIEMRKNGTDTPVEGDLYGDTLFLRFTPQCPAGGTYTINMVDARPNCSLSSLEEPFNHNFPPEPVGS